ncbi:MAG: hypothetical protein V4543_11490 [Bacteroidota bacterium]
MPRLKTFATYVLKVTAVLIVVSALLVAAFLVFRTESAYVPERIAGVPKSAVWRGTGYEGFWIDYVSTRNRTIRLRIYNDYDGRLALDADFRFPAKYAGAGRRVVLKSIFCFMPDRLELKNSKTPLVPLKPYYGGYFQDP